MEEWKEIKEFEGIYAISSEGRVKSLSNSKTKKEKILKPYYNEGYPKVNLYLNGKRFKKYVHRLVAEAFLNKEEEHLTFVNHKDGNRNNPNKTNLEWVTPAQNNYHRYYNTSSEFSFKQKKLLLFMKKYNLTIEDIIELLNS